MKVTSSAAIAEPVSAQNSASAAAPGLAEATPTPEFWKIAPEHDASLWKGWKGNGKEGYVSIGWPALDDVAELPTEAAFKEKLAECKYPGKGAWQVWYFRHIPIGARIVANHGTHTALGFGTVIAPYHFDPKDGEYPHRLTVRWDDLEPRDIKGAANFFRRTLIKLDQKRFDDLLACPKKTTASDETPRTGPHEGEMAGEGKVSAEDKNQAQVVPPPPARNLILYGPPGTGKTWATVQKALELVEQSSASLERPQQLERFRALQKARRIELVTFHQSYGYEEFVEGIRPALSSSGKDVRYVLQEGIFKGIALRAAAAGLLEASGLPGFDDLWTRLVEGVKKEGSYLVKGKGGKDYVLRVSANDNLVTRQCKVKDGAIEEETTKLQRASKDNSRLLWEHRQEFGGSLDGYTHEKGVQIFSKAMTTEGVPHKGGHHYTALWIVCRELLELSQRLVDTQQPIMPTPERAQAVLDRLSHEHFCFSSETPQFVLVIDEINRGNISKILGELITLLEPEKRLNMPDETVLRLSGSHFHSFALPPNLHIIGTMNTADRSIALMDVALRRRFDFEEVMPDAGVLKAELERQGVGASHVTLVVNLFVTLNERIEWLYDREHQLGHTYFFRATSLEMLRHVLLDRVIPLLQEYFYGAWEKVCIVLGCPYDDSGRPKRPTGPSILAETPRRYRAALIDAVASCLGAGLGLDEEAEDERLRYTVSRGFCLAESIQLVPYFLGVLLLDDAGWKAREAALIAEHAQTSVVTA